MADEKVSLGDLIGEKPTTQKVSLGDLLDDSQKKSQQVSTTTPSQQSQTSTTGSGAAFKPLETSGTDEPAPFQENVLSPEAEKNKNPLQDEVNKYTGGKDVREWVWNKHNDLVNDYGELVKNTALLREFPKQQKFQQYQQLQNQLSQLKPDSPQYKTVKKQVDDLLAQPLVDIPQDYTWSGGDTTLQPQLMIGGGQHGAVPVKQKDEFAHVNTVGDFVKMYNETASKSQILNDRSKKNQDDINAVISAQQKLNGFEGNKDGVRELNALQTFGKEVYGTLDKALFSAKYLLSDNDTRLAMQRQQAGQQLIEPEQPANKVAEYSGTAGAVLPYLIPGFGLERAGATGLTKTVGTMLMDGTLFGLTNAATGSIQQYNEILNKTRDENQALNAANSVFKSNLATGAATGSVLMPLFGALGSKVGGKFVGDDIASEIATNGTKNIGYADYMKYMFGKHSVSAAPFALQTYVDNKIAQENGSDRSSLEGVGKAYVAAGIMGAGLDHLAYAYDKLSPVVKDIYLNGFAKYAPEMVTTTLDKAASDGTVNPVIADKIKNEVFDRSLAFAEMPKNLTPEKEQEVLPLVQQKNELVKQQAENKALPDEHFTNQIESIDRKISETLGTPLTEDEQAHREKLTELKNSRNDKGQFENQLSDSEKEILAHYDNRQKSVDAVKAEEDRKQRVADLKRVNVEQEQLPLVKSEEDRQILDDKTKYATRDKEGNIVTHVKGEDNPIATVSETTHVAPHGDTKNDKLDKISGRNDEDLSEEGKKQASATGKAFKEAWDKNNTPQEQRVIMVSPLKRAQQTGDIIAKESGGTVKVDPNLTAWDIKDFAGTTNEEFAPIKKWFIEHPDATKYEPEGEAKVIQPHEATEETPYISENGKYKLFNKNGEIVVKSSTGEDVPQTTAKKYLREFKDKYKYDNEKDFQGKAQNVNQVIDQSENPAELASIIRAEPNHIPENDLDYKERAIASVIGTVKRDSYIRHGDENNIAMSIAKEYLRKDGEPLDMIAMEAEQNAYGDYDAQDPRITEQDVIDFMHKYPSKEVFWKQKNPVRDRAAKRFKELTGFNPDEKTIKLAADEYDQRQENVSGNQEGTGSRPQEVKSGDAEKTSQSIPHYGKEIGESVNDLGKRMEQVNNDRLNTYEPDTKIITHGENRQMLDAIDKNGGKFDENALKTFGDTERPEDIFLTKPKSDEKAETKTEETVLENKDTGGKTAGISNRVMADIAQRLGITAPESGEGINPADVLPLGKELLAAGADVGKLMEEFNNGAGVTPEGVAIIRAKSAELTKAVYDAMDKGKGVEEAKAALEKFQEDTKPYATKASNVFKSYQGETDVDTGSWSALSAAYKEEHGEEPNAKQIEEAKQLSDKVNSLTTEVESLKQKLSDAIDAGVKASKEAGKTYTERAKKAADSFRKLKTKPFTFRDANGNEVSVHTLGPTWNDAVELGAKAIELSGKVADGVKAAIDHIADSDWYRKLSDADKDRFAKELEAHYQKPEDDIQTRFADKKDSNFTPQDAKDIWDYTKENYLDKGQDLGKTVANVSMDLGLSQKQVLDAITSPKGASKITDEMYRKQSDQRAAVQNAKEWVKYANQAKDSAARKGFRALAHIPDVLFSLKVFGHGTVAPITHAGMDLFQPSGWKNYFKFFLEGFKNAYGSRAEYEKRMEFLRNDPMYNFAKRSGLAVDPSVRYDDYQTFNKYLNKGGILGRAIKAGIDIGDRGFNALKTYRLEKFKQLYNGLSNVEKADPNTASEIAKIVNHSTGTSDFGFKSEGLNKAVSATLFAPKLEYSRWQRLIVEPAKALSTITNWENSTPSDRAAAKIVSKRSGEMIATYGAALAANAGILALIGSDDKVNMTDPTKSDYLKFKIAGKEVNPTGGMLSSVKFVGNLLGEAFTKDKDRKDKYYEMAGDYLRGKLSPFAGTVFDFATHKDYDKNILPPFDDKLTFNKRTHTFNHRMSWSEYAEKNLSPIPIAEAIKNVEDGMKNKGMKQADITTVLNGIFVGATSGLTGLNIKEEKK